MWKKFLALVALCAASSLANAAPLTYLSPGSISAGDLYASQGYSNVGVPSFFSGVSSIEVLPPLESDGVTPYSFLGSGFVGGVDDATNTGSVTFNTPGPYTLRVTYLDARQDYFYNGATFNDQPGPNPPPAPAPYKKIPTPAPDIVIVDSNDYQAPNANPPPATNTKNLKDTQPTFPATTTKVEKTSWADVIAYLKQLPANANKHVELSGHGLAGELYWNNVKVLDSTTLAQLDSLVGKVSNLTFMACYVGANATFLQSVANKLGASSGYTQPVGGNGSDWFIWNDGVLVSKVRVPEPASGLVFVGFLVLVGRRHRAAA
ncbi:MAG: hypothetical protein H7Z14_11235 [Anaerolineae bacterium]|nr:hypothetical protein [Phycisphaerae bacterium]